MSITTEDLADDIRTILADAAGPLTPRVIAARSQLADGVADVVQVLARMAREGEIHQHQGERGLAFSAAAPPADPAPTAAEAPTGHAEQIIAALGEDGPQTSRRLAERTGIRPKRVSDVLCLLKRAGKVARTSAGLYELADGGSQPRAAKSGKSRLKPAKSGQSRPKPATAGAAPEQAADPVVVALRNDGILEIRRRLDADADEIVAIRPQEWLAVEAFLARVRGGAQA